MAGKFDLTAAVKTLTARWERIWKSRSGRWAVGAVALLLVAFFWLGWRARYPDDTGTKNRFGDTTNTIALPEFDSNATLPADAQMAAANGPVTNAGDDSWVLYQSTSDGISAVMPGVPQRQENSLAMSGNGLTADGYVYTSTDDKVTYAITYQQYAQLPDGVSVRDFFTATDEESEEENHNLNTQWFEVNGALVRETSGYDAETKMYLRSRATLLSDAIVGVSAASREPINAEEFDYVARSLQVKQ